MGQADPGSFRDPASHVVLGETTVTRVLDDRGLEDWRALVATRFFTEATTSGRLISTVQPDENLGVLEHPRLAMIVYPFEWTFTMLKDAAILQLDLMEAALAEGMILKDATPYNIQFVGGRPQFIDVGSFERYRQGEPWVAYRQFCRQFLYPLMLRAWVGVPFQPWLRGDPEGPRADHMRQLLPIRRRLSPSALGHVELQARAESRLQGEAVRSDLAQAGFSSDLILVNVRKLRSLVESMSFAASDKIWSEYYDCTHVGRDRATKATFLTGVVGQLKPSTVLDLGANDGHFARVAADSGATVVAVDGDEAVLDGLYRSLEPGSSIVPVLTDLSNPSPSQGWAGVERPGLFSRVRPDLVVAYGLIHHLIYTASIPPALVVDWLASFGVDVVVEFVSPQDPMVKRLTANKNPEELHPDRDKQSFERLVGEHFRVVSVLELEGGTRWVYHLSR